MKVRSAAEFRSLYGPWALVAGASQGLGAEFARQLAQKGMNLVLVARGAGKLADLTQQLSARYAIQARYLALDLAQEQSAESILSQTQEVDIGLLVYNAAFSVIGPFLSQSLEDHQRELDINVRTPMLLAYKFCHRFVQRKRGGLILLSSLSAAQGSAMISNYAATKAYNQLLAEGLWEELRESGVDVLACCPGATRTPGYLASLTSNGHQRSVSAMDPDAVVAETLAALGRQPRVVPGRFNRFSDLMIRRFLPRQTAIRLMGRVLRNLYPSSR